MSTRRGPARPARALGALLSLALCLLHLAPPASADTSVATYVVTFDAPPTANDVEVLRGVAHAVTPYTNVPAAAVVLPPSLVPLLRNLPGVRGVWVNQRYALIDQKANESIRADRAWGPYAGGLGHTGTGWTGKGIGIGVVDAGVDGTHPDLCAAPAYCKGTPVKTVQNVKFVGNTDKLSPYAYVENVVSTDNTSGHGSHVAGIAAGFGTASAVPGTYQGVAPGADIVGLGTGEAVEVVNVLAAFDWVLNNHHRYNIKVLNNSWGPGYGTPYGPDHPVNLGVDKLWDAGISVVFGAGNDGPRTDSLNAFSVHPKAMSVAATNKHSKHLGFFSSRGVPGSPFWHPTVAAPGENITGPRSLAGTTTHAGDASTATSADAVSQADAPYYGTVSGTSMAAPHVSGVIALMQQASYGSRGVYLTPRQVKDILQNTAQTGGPAGMPNYQRYTMGAGLVDASAAVAAAAAGTHTHPHSDSTRYDVAPFAGSVGPAAVVPTSTFSSTVDVAPGALSLDVMVDWKVVYGHDLDITVYDPSGAVRGNTQLLCGGQQPNGYSSFCSSAPNERLTFVAPAPGSWKVVVAPAPGTWKVVVGGFVNTTENVRGLWSVAYAAGVPGAFVPAAPAALTLTAETPAAVQGRPDALVATVTDASGNPLPNVPVTWTSTGAGSAVNAEAYTAYDGIAGAAALSDAPGAQTVTASAGGFSASITVTWLGVTAPCLTCGTTTVNTPGKASGGGWFVAGGTKRHFGVDATYNAGAAMPGGALSYDGSGIAVSASVVDRFRINGATAVLSGPATVNGRGGYRYEVTVTDNGEPGRTDTFAIKLTKVGDLTWSYGSSGTLGGGNVQVAAGS